MIKLFLGIDGGGTKTAMTLIDENMNVVDKIKVGPSSVDTVNLKQMKANLQEGLDKLKYEGIIVSVFAGIGGISSTEDQNIVNCVLKSFDQTKGAIVNSNNDCYNALASLDGTMDGMIIILGTGSVAFGIHNGKSHRCGGYCYQEGDCGSGYDLGYKALKYYARVLDGRKGPSKLSSDISCEIGVYSYKGLITYFQTATRTQIASLARIVASSNEEVAKNIVMDSVDEAVKMIETVYKNLGFKAANLTIIGSLGNSDTFYHEYLIDKINRLDCNITLCKAKYTADYASSLLAYNYYTGDINV